MKNEQSKLYSFRNFKINIIPTLIHKIYFLNNLVMYENILICKTKKTKK